MQEIVGRGCGAVGRATPREPRFECQHRQYFKRKIYVWHSWLSNTQIPRDPQFESWHWQYFKRKIYMGRGCGVVAQLVEEHPEIPDSNPSIGNISNVKFIRQ